jgi:hypothetical protein
MLYSTSFVSRKVGWIRCLLGEGLQNPTLYAIFKANFDKLPKLHKPAASGFFYNQNSGKHITPSN